MKKHFKIIPLKPVPLTKRTKLTPKQLLKIEGAGNGETTKYDCNGHQDLELTRRLAKARLKAQRYVLFNDQLGRRLYIADPVKIDLKPNEAPLTFSVKEALNFYRGFDDSERKILFWNKSFKIFTWLSTNI